jgi:hypothetical protein
MCVREGGKRGAGKGRLRRRWRKRAGEDGAGPPGPGVGVIRSARAGRLDGRVGGGSTVRQCRPGRGVARMLVREGERESEGGREGGREREECVCV